jgi:hypothetical protein
MTTPLNTFDGQTTLTTSTAGRIARTSFPSASSDQQNFIALNPSAVLESGGATSRSPCGDLSPVRVRTTDAQNRIFVYPRNSSDPSADTVRDSFVYTSSTDFRSALGRVSGNVYVGRTSAGGVGTSVDLNGDGTPDATFSASCGFLLQLQNGVPTKVETDLNVAATIGGRVYNLVAYTPVAVIPGTGSQAPSITTQPVNKSVTAGQTATFSVVASGTAPLTYQWQKNTVAISGATGASYTTPATTTADNGATFRVIVTNSAGSVTSASVTLTVAAAAVPPSITTQPVGKSVTTGQTATFSVVASGTAPLTYQWQKNSVAISGATSASYTTPATVIADNGAVFRVIVTNSAGSVTSANAALTVAAPNIPPTVSIADPVNGAIVFVGTDLSVLANASDSDGSVANVKLYVNNQLVRQEGVSPFEWGLAGQNDVLLQNLAVGTYTLKAVATDNAGAVTTAILVTVTVTNATTGIAGLAAHWKLDETGSATTASDSSGNGFDGNLANYQTPKWTTGKIGGALNFNGESHIVGVGSPTALTNLTRYTIAVWIKPRTFGGSNGGRIVCKRKSGTIAGWSLFLSSSAVAFRQTFSVTEGDWTTPDNSIDQGVWKHVAVSYDNSSVANKPTFYINGTPVTTTVDTAPAGSVSPDAESNLKIGNNAALSHGFDGAIDDVRIYDRILNAAEIDALATVMPAADG